MNESGPGPSDQERAFAALNLAGRGDSPEAQKLLQRRKNRAIRIRIAWMLRAHRWRGDRADVPPPG